MWSQLPDFDTLKEVAEKDPAALENFRQHAVKSVILSAPRSTRERLRGLQFQIDSQRQLHPSPLGSCVKISGMMHSAFTQLGELLTKLAEAEPTDEEQIKRPDAKILHFPQK